jgi:hypothetical protein
MKPPQGMKSGVSWSDHDEGCPARNGDPRDSVLPYPSAPVLAAPYFNTSVKCRRTDPDGRIIPTRIGNSVRLEALLWKAQHPDLKNCQRGYPREGGQEERGRLECWGVAIKGCQVVNFVIVVQYARKMMDREYSAGKGQKIGVVTVFCRRMGKCPLRGGPHRLVTPLVKARQPVPEPFWRRSWRAGPRCSWC